MGEATYFLKARFASAEKAQEALPKIRAFLLENREAYAYWQANRDKAPAQFWPDFKIKLPQITWYLGGKVGGNCNNDLSGFLDVGNLGDDVHLSIAPVDASVIQFWSDDVWHFTSWDTLCSWLEIEFGAIKTAWTSSEFKRNNLDAIRI